MKCEICGSENPPLVMILPVHQASGQYDTLACESCAEKSDAFCTKHSRPHMGFKDGSNACLYCIDELISVNRLKATSIVSRFISRLSQEKWDDLVEVAELQSLHTGETQNISILRLVVTKAVRAGQWIEEVVATVEENDSINYIIW